MSLDYCNNCLEMKKVVSKSDCCHKICNECDENNNICLVCNPYTIFNNVNTDEELINMYCKHKEPLDVDTLVLDYIDDISFISVFKNLKKLTVVGHSTRTIDMSVISSLTQLKWLSIQKTHNINLDFLSDLSNLETLKIFSSSNITMKHLSKLSKLTELAFYDAKKVNMKDISNIPNLKQLIVEVYESVDLSPLRELSKDVYIQIVVKNISDLEWMRGVNISELSICESKITDIEPLRWMTNMKKLSWYTNASVKCFEPISELVNLVELSIITDDEDKEDKPLTDITFLTKLTNIEKLDLEGNRVKDITPLKGLTKLVELNLCGNEVDDLTPIKDCIQLEELNLFENDVSVLTPLRGLKKLVKLNLHSNPVSDLTSLTFLTSLECVDLHDTSCDADNLKPLRKLIPTLSWIGIHEDGAEGLSKKSKLWEIIVYDDAWYW